MDAVRKVVAHANYAFILCDVLPTLQSIIKSVEWWVKDEHSQRAAKLWWQCLKCERGSDMWIAETVWQSCHQTSWCLMGKSCSSGLTWVRGDKDSERQDLLYTAHLWSISLHPVAYPAQPFHICSVVLRPSNTIVAKTTLWQGCLCQ